jgi:hypothetical protein
MLARSLMVAASISKGGEVIPSSTLLLLVLALFGQFSKQFERDAKDENDKRIHAQFDHSPGEFGIVHLFNGEPGSNREDASRRRDDANEKKGTQRGRIFFLLAILAIRFTGSVPGSLS